MRNEQARAEGLWGEQEAVHSGITQAWWEHQPSALHVRVEPVNKVRVLSACPSSSGSSLFPGPEEAVFRDGLRLGRGVWESRRCPVEVPRPLSGLR